VAEASQDGHWLFCPHVAEYLW